MTDNLKPGADRWMVTKRIGVLMAALGLALSAACGPASDTRAAGERVRVVATFSVLGDLVRNIGGEHIELKVLAGPGVDTHTYTPSASDAAELAQAELVVENGLEFETWLDDLYIASGSRAERVTTSAGIVTLAAEAVNDEENAESAPDHDHGAVDPHVWHSAANAIIMVENIRAALSTVDPDHAADFAANAAAYTVQLQDLDEWIGSEVERVPVERRVLVTTHDTLGYFAARYGFEVVGTILPTSTEGASPSAQELATLVEVIRAAKVPAIFSENMASNSLLSQVATEAGVQVVGSLFTDALGPESSAGATYLEMMRYNTTAIVQALAG
jgi:ABC-type Zn uptake system ZnuABC Zn-binding protein ZnuA